MQGQKQILAQQQRLSLSPQLVQSIKMMAMPFADLRDRILEEAEKNPALEIVSDPFETADWSPSGSGGGDAESDEHRDFIEGTLTRPATLQEHLLSQLGEQPLPPAVKALAELVIQNLDRDGFHVVSPTELPGAGDGAVLEAALTAVRSLDPPGCATVDFHESLVVQARLLSNSFSAAHRDPAILAAIEILEHHFELLEKGRPEALVKALAKKGVAYPSLDLEAAEDVFEIIRSLDPFPGRSRDTSPGTYIVPDVIVKKTEDGYAAVINDEEIPVLGLSPFFMDIEQGEKTGKGKKQAKTPEGPVDPEARAEARDFARESLKEAQWFIHTLARRNLTILKLTRALIVFQRDFFMYGPARVSPLRMKDVAAEIGLHEATVSRAANGKYLQCEWGLFELKYFFSNQVGSVRPATGDSASLSYSSGRFSKQGVKELVRQMIVESKDSLSDQKIADQLALRGIKLARRTVAKYRGELTLKSSFDR